MIAFIDVETTGLHERNGYLLEVGIVLTDDSLVEVAHENVIVRPADMDAVLRSMEPVVLTMHQDNGLLAELSEGLLLKEAEDVLIGFAEQWVNWSEDIATATPIAGNGIAFDQRWLREHMSLFEEVFHYREDCSALLDVSVINILALRWAPRLYERRPKAVKKAHRALADARESIATLRYYRDMKFIEAAAAA